MAPYLGNKSVDISKNNDLFHISIYKLFEKKHICFKIELHLYFLLLLLLLLKSVFLFIFFLF